MKLLLQKNSQRLQKVAWWSCVVTLPWLDIVNSLAVAFLLIVTILDEEFVTRLRRLKTSRWAWPFFAYYLLLAIGVAYSPDKNAGLAALAQKLSFIVLPIAAIVGREISASMIEFLKRSFVYSCTLIVFLSLVVAAINAATGAAAFNFDGEGMANFNLLHPDASPSWMHFSYIQVLRWIDLHPAYLSMYLVFCLVILFTDTYNSRRQIVIHSFLGAALAGFVALLSSRMAIIAFLVSAIYLCTQKIRQHRPLSAVPILLTALLLGILLWVNPVARFRVVDEPMKTTYRADSSVMQWNSVSYRLLEWEGSWAVIRDNPLLGVGTSGWKMAMGKFYSSFSPSTSALMYNAHNQFLQTWMENGVLALIAFVFCMFAFIFHPSTDQSYVVFIIIFSLMCLTESIGERQKGIVFFTLFQSLFLGQQNVSK